MLYPGAGYPGLYFPVISVDVALEYFDFEVVLRRGQTIDTLITREFEGVVGVLSDLLFSVDVER